MRRAAVPLALAALIGGCAPSVSGDGYDFLVLALAWSPSYCESEGADADRRQCAEGRELGFVVHGLWPQFEGGWPEFCDTNEPRRVPNALVRDYLDLIPSAGLMGHQWRKHGSCAGLSQQDYFALVRAARERVAVPAAYRGPKADTDVAPDTVERAFIAANPGMKEDGIAVSCDNRRIADVRICLTKGLEFRSCAAVDARACRLPRASMPAPD